MPVITFADDDGGVRALTEMIPTLDAKGVKATFGVITDNVGTSNNMSKAELMSLQNSGHDIVSHSKIHSLDIFRTNLPTEADSVIADEFKLSQEWLVSNGFLGADVLIYPYGQFDSAYTTRIKAIARKYFDYGMNSLGSYNKSPCDNMYMDRVFIDYNQDFTTVLKPIIDATITNKGWLILGTHSYNTATFNATYLATIIDYIKSQNVLILPFKQAMLYKGNILSVGEFTAPNNHFIGYDGTLLKGGQFVIDTINTSWLMDDPITKYPLYSETITQMNGTKDTCVHEGGILTTYRGGLYFSTQYFTTYNTKRLFVRKWDEVVVPNAWGAWIEQATKAYVDSKLSVAMVIIPDQYAGTMNDPITAYGQYQETIVQLTGAKDVLTSEGGVMRVFRGGMYFSYAQFISATYGKVYYRKWTGTDVAGSWATWKLVTAV